MMFKFNMTSNVKKGLLIGAAGLAVFAGGFGAGMTAEKVTSLSDRRDRFEKRCKIFEEPDEDFFGFGSDNGEYDEDFSVDEDSRHDRRSRGFNDEYYDDFETDQKEGSIFDEYDDLFEGDEFFSDRKNSSSGKESTQSGATDQSSSGISS